MVIKRRGFLREYDPIGFTLDGHEYICIAYMDEKDGFLIEEDWLRTFKSREELTIYAEQNGMTFNGSELFVLSIDRLQSRFARIEQTRMVDCHAFLNFWNLVSDAAYSLNRSFYGDREEVTFIYDRVFYGTNPPALRKDGEYFTPTWTDVELEVLKGIFREGKKLLESSLTERV